jgi:hypothetical protein
MLKKIGAALAGIVVAVIVVMIIQGLSHLVFAPAVMPDMNDPRAVQAFVASMPAGAFLAVLASYVLGTIAGGTAAGRIAGERPLRYAGIVGAFVIVGAGINIVTIPHPLWFVIAVVVTVPLSTAIASKLGARKPG